ncbi:ABC transporter ATP-binding protein [Salipiger sp. P9]|uniref:ABC transporter ATP-binding protein n=1 Tax=Salipiger pentaromativorans TaxID=2943193 RepID=UPI002157C205|nr:ABC transporter ATP-binding protein [Salipiger pentaromativorans]MCR8547501.1 ABC transporter ATP-binding protein [Salipiger pentaromativorans]
MTAPLIDLAGLSRHFALSSGLNTRFRKGGAKVVRAVDSVDIEIARGETFGLVGESGCGKSTVARLAVGLMRPTEGAVRFDRVDLASAGRRDLAALRRRIQMVFQDPYSSMNARWRIREIIAEPLRTLNLCSSPAEMDRRIDELLTLVGLSPADKRKYPHEFSGGQRQRISIARALSTNPEFLVCDEPTSALDVSVQSQILNLMKDLQAEFDLTFLFISHNLAVISHMADRVGVMYLGRIVEQAPAQRLFSAPRHPYTKLLLETVPDLNRIGYTRKPMSGEVPNPINPPSGCPFHPRCAFANDRCKQERPSIRADGQGTLVACHGVQEGRI